MLSTDQRALDREARLTISRELGHERPAIVAVYCGWLASTRRDSASQIRPGFAEDMVPQLPGILEKLDHPQATVALERLRDGHKLGKAYVDQTKLTDHHAILPTGKATPPSLPPTLRKIYDLIVDRFVGVFRFIRNSGR